jgi:hypothetical protein
MSCEYSKGIQDAINALRRRCKHWDGDAATAADEMLDALFFCEGVNRKASQSAITMLDAAPTVMPVRAVRTATRLETEHELTIPAFARTIRREEF